MYPIRISGNLLSKITMSEEHMEMLKSHLVENHLGPATQVHRNGPNIQIDFFYDGSSDRYMTPGNFAFGESVAYISQICEELQLGLEGTILIHDARDSSAASPRWPGAAQKLEVSDGIVHLTKGMISPDGVLSWNATTTQVEVTARHLGV